MKKIKLNTQHIEAILYHEDGNFALFDRPSEELMFSSLQTKSEVIDDLQPVMSNPSPEEPDIFEIHELYGQIDFVLDRDLGEEVNVAHLPNAIINPMASVFAPQDYITIENHIHDTLVVDYHHVEDGIQTYRLIPDYISNDTLILQGDWGEEANMVGIIPCLLDNLDDWDDIKSMMDMALRYKTWKVMLPDGSFTLTRAIKHEMSALYKEGIISGYEEISYTPLLELV